MSSVIFFTLDLERCAHLKYIDQSLCPFLAFPRRLQSIVNPYLHFIYWYVSYIILLVNITENIDCLHYSTYSAILQDINTVHMGLDERSMGGGVQCPTQCS